VPVGVRGGDVAQQARRRRLQKVSARAVAVAAAGAGVGVATRLRGVYRSLASVAHVEFESKT